MTSRGYSGCIVHPRTQASNAFLAKSILRVGSAISLSAFLLLGCSAAALDNDPAASQSSPMSSLDEHAPSPSPHAVMPTEFHRDEPGVLAGDLDPGTSPEVPSGPCFRRVTTFDGLPATIERAVNSSSSIFVGTVTEVGSGRWNTEGGAMPADVDDLDAFSVMRFVRVEVDRLFSGDGLGPAETVWVPGGSIGCQRFDDERFPPDVAADAKFVFVTWAVPPKDGPEAIVGVYAMWPVLDGDHVATPDGLMSMDDLGAVIASAADDT